MSSKVCSCILFCRLLAKANFNTLLQCKYYTSLYIYTYTVYKCFKFITKEKRAGVFHLQVFFSLLSIQSETK